MSIIFDRNFIAAPMIGRRCIAAILIAIGDVAAILACFHLDALSVFGGGNNVSCPSLGLSQLVCQFLDRDTAPHSLLPAGTVIGVLIVLGLYDPRPLLFRLEESRRPLWWLMLNAAGAVIFISPYLVAAAGAPISLLAPLAPYLLVLGSAMMAVGLLFWLSDTEQLQGTLSPLHVLVAMSILPATFATKELVAKLGWGVSAIQTATFYTTNFLLELIGQTTVIEPEQSIIGINDFRVTVAAGCSGVAGIFMVCALMSGYILVKRDRLHMRRALLLIPLAAGLSWVLNGVRIATLLMIGASVSPQLAVDGFHTNAGWLAFCALSAMMLVFAENMSWFHRRPISTMASAVPVLSDPVVAQIAPFVVLLVSSLLSGVIFLQPEAGYPLRAILMATAVLLFWKSYRAEIGAIPAVPVLSGVLVALVWLGVKAGNSPLPVGDILGPVSGDAVKLWVLFTVSGTVFLVPFIEEMFFRGYLLRRLDFGGRTGMIISLTVTSVLFGALHSNFLLAVASGFLFGILALRRGRVFDAVAAHTIANALIAAWALWTGDWSVI